MKFLKVLFLFALSFSSLAGTSTTAGGSDVEPKPNKRVGIYEYRDESNKYEDVDLEKAFKVFKDSRFNGKVFVDNNPWAIQTNSFQYCLGEVGVIDSVNCANNNFEAIKNESFDYKSNDTILFKLEGNLNLHD